MRNSCRGWVLLCASTVTLSCRTAPPNWNGTWKLNPTKSSYQGQVLTISTSSDGGYSFDENSTFTLRCDGKDRPIGNNRALACLKSGATGLDITQEENGVKTRATHDELSPDGKVFTTTVTEFRPNGPVITSQIGFSRLSGSPNDFAGQWRDTSYLQQHENMGLRLDNLVLHIDYPSASQHMDAQLDGVDSPVGGLHAPIGTTFAVRPSGDREFITVTKRDGKVFSQGTLQLSNDGREITNSSWKPERPSDVATLVYERMQ